mgnify:CR=1 FL=1
MTRHSQQSITHVAFGTSCCANCQGHLNTHATCFPCAQPPTCKDNTTTRSQQARCKLVMGPDPRAQRQDNNSCLTWAHPHLECRSARMQVSTGLHPRLSTPCPSTRRRTRRLLCCQLLLLLLLLQQCLQLVHDRLHRNIQPAPSVYSFALALARHPAPWQIQPQHAT